MKPLTFADVPAAEQAADRYQRLVRDNAVARGAAAMRSIIPADVVDDRDLLDLAAVAVDGAWPAFCEQADLFASNGRLVARLWRALDQLRWQLERRNLADAAEQALNQTRTGGAQT